MDIDYKDIAQTIKRFWAGNGITIQQAANKLGISSQAVCNQLSGKPITPKTAKAYNAIWGFNEDYMITGRGTLLPEQKKEDVYYNGPEGVFIPAETLRMYTSMAQSIDRLTQLVDRLTSMVDYVPKGGLYPRSQMPK